MKEKCVGRDVADLIAPSANALGSERPAVELERPRVRQHEAHQDIGDGTLAGAGRSHQRDNFPGRNNQAQIFDGGHARFGVGERYAVGGKFAREREPIMRMRGRLGRGRARASMPVRLANDGSMLTKAR